MKPTRIDHFLAAVFVAVLLAASSSLAAERPVTDRPSIIYILADDLGYGDVQALNPERGKIPTPHMDRLAEQGMTFTDAHTSCPSVRQRVMALLQADTTGALDCNRVS